jgi:hypothetical protein
MHPGGGGHDGDEQDGGETLSRRRH